MAGFDWLDSKVVRRGWRRIPHFKKALRTGLPRGIAAGLAARKEAEEAFAEENAKREGNPDVRVDDASRGSEDGE